MTIEEAIFKRAVADFTKLEKFGFVKSGTDYCYETVFFNGDFKAVVKVDFAGKVSGQVYDLASEDIYFPLRVEEMAVGYVGEVRAAYEKILTDVKTKCCSENYFVGTQTNRLTRKIYAKYGDNPRFPWEKYQDCGVFKNPDSGKWYGLVMTIDRSKLDTVQSGKIEIINLKIDEIKIPQLIQQKGFYPAYHMNKKSWITVILDDTIADDVIFKYIEESHSFTLVKKHKKDHKP